MSLFVVYNMTTTEVKAVYDNTSEELLELFELVPVTLIGSLLLDQELL